MSGTKSHCELSPNLISFSSMSLVELPTSPAPVRLSLRALVRPEPSSRLQPSRLELSAVFSLFRPTAGKNLRKRGNQNSAQTDGRMAGGKMESGRGKRGQPGRDRERGAASPSSLRPPFLQCCASASPLPRLVLVPQSRFGRRKERERETEQGNREKWGLC